MPTNVDTYSSRTDFHTLAMLLFDQHLHNDISFFFLLRLRSFSFVIFSAKTRKYRQNNKPKMEEKKNYYKQKQNINIYE